jgi:L-histidine N-alpha-methyltransferase
LPVPPGRKLFLFLGGTIGNFEESEALRFLAGLWRQMAAGDYLLLGADRVKDTGTLEAAYDDAAGVTACFNLNVLRVINRELGADFDLEGFTHRAIFAEPRSRIEMYLVARWPQQVHVAALERSYRFAEREAIFT